MRLPLRSELSEQQEDFLMKAPFDCPVLCVGPPGTGKTVLALYRAAILNKKNKVDFVMYSKLLNRYIERSVEELKMDVTSKTWHSWLYSLWKKGNGRYKFPKIDPYLPNFQKMIELVKERKIGRPENMYWDHLIIDEGQDFPKDFYFFLTVLSCEEAILSGRKPQGITIFADENQRMEETHNATISQIKFCIPDAKKFQVSINYRNSGPIAKLASYFFVGLPTGKPDIPQSAKGLMPMLCEFNTLEDEMSSVVKWLHNNNDLSAGIIVPDRKIQKEVVNIIRPLAAERDIKIQKYSSGTNPKKIDFYKIGTITIICDKSCKGLEFDGVFIPQLQIYKTDGADEDFFKMKMYVMISRAREYLQLSFSDCDEIPHVVKRLPQPEEGILQWKLAKR